MIERMYIVRHGETESNRDDLVSGYSDNPTLTDIGVEQAYRRGLELHEAVDQVFSSPKERCYVTGSLVFARSVPKRHRLQGLNERRYGRFDGGPNEAWKDFIGESTAGLSDDQVRYHEFGHGIENENDVIKRALGAAAKVAYMNNGNEVGVSTSGGIMRGLLLGSGYEIGTGKIQNLAKLVIDYDDQAARIAVVEMDGIEARVAN